LSVGKYMEFINFILGLLHDPRNAIAGWIITFGPIWVYAPLFFVIFLETGLVVTPFLPGDSLLFAAGVFCADGGGLNIWAALCIFSFAAILGNTSNYWIGRAFGHAIIDSGKVKALTPERIAKTHSFFEKWGSLAVVVTRFFPIIRTIAPFVAGTSRMGFPRFTLFNAIGGISWVCLFTLIGYFFGGIPFVQTHFEWILVAIIVVSFAPTVIGLIKARVSGKKKDKENTAASHKEGDDERA
jgi:membrane-associated protein